MKSAIVLLPFLFLSFALNAQCILDAGPNVTVCNTFAAPGSANIGNGIQITNGVAPYTYVWETYYEYTIGSTTLKYYASDFLNDTSIANPLVSSYDDSITFKLTVTDSLGQSCTDSLVVYFSNYGSHLGSWGAIINRGDSVFVNLGPNVMGGYGALTYLWQPNHGLTDSTSTFLGWVKPEVSTNYYCTVTDTSGCSATGAPFVLIHVNVLSVNENKFKTTAKIYPNPVANTLFIETKNAQTATLISVTGMTIKTEKLRSGKTLWDVSALAEGIYYLTLREAGKTPLTQMVVIGR